MPEARHGRPEATGDGDGDGDAEARLPAYRVVGNHNSLRSPVPLPRRVQKPAHHERAVEQAFFTIEGKREFSRLFPMATNQCKFEFAVRGHASMRS